MTVDPPVVQLDSEASDSNIYGSALSPGLFEPVPFVAVNGEDVASGPGGELSDLMVIDGLSFTWGRDEVLDQPTPATGTLRLFDPSGTWATRADRRGQPVTIRYEGIDPTTSTLVTSVNLRGRIGHPVRPAPKTVTDPVTGQAVRGALIELPLQSIVVDLGNDVPTTAYPAETMGARLDRLAAAAQASGVCLGGVSMRTYWRDPQVAAVAAKDQPSLLEHLTAVYDSSGADRMTYIPGSDTLTFLPRRDYPSSRGVAGLWWDANDPLLARGGQGAYIRSYSLTPPGGSAGLPLYLDALSLEYDPDEGVTTPPRFTRVAISHPDSSAAYATRNIEKKVALEDGGLPDESVVGVRTAKLESLVAWNAWADLALDDQAQFVRREGSRWVPGPLRLSTRRTGGFETANIGILMLGGYERNSLVFLQRSWLPEFGIRPVFGVMGGTISYSDGGWDVEFSVAPMTTTLKQHAITWEEIDDGTTTYELQWHDTDHARGLHESVTYEDMAYCSTGLNVSTVPADAGWDA